MTGGKDTLLIEGHALRLKCSLVPWDSATLGRPVAQITQIEARVGAADEFERFERWRDDQSVDIVSCRLPASALRESMFLEARGFRFVELVLRYRSPVLGPVALTTAGPQVSKALIGDLAAIGEIAASSFRDDRYHLDPRLSPAFAGERYRRWVLSIFEYPSQCLYKATLGSRIVGFLIAESEGSPWHLAGVASDAQGKGVGEQIFRAFLQCSRTLGAERAEGVISARNIRVLNLFAKIGCRFSEPQITLHWVRDQEPGQDFASNGE